MLKQRIDWNLPRVVKVFIGSLDIKPESYIFAIITMGGDGHGYHNPRIKAEEIEK